MWPRRCSVYRWRELVAGAGMEQENLSPRWRRPGFLAARGRTASSEHCEWASTDAGHRGGPARSSGEGPVMGPERRGRAVQGRLEVNPSGEEPTDRPRQKNAGLWEPYDARLSRTVLTERVKGRFPPATHQGLNPQPQSRFPATWRASFDWTGPVLAVGTPPRQAHLGGVELGQRSIEEGGLVGEDFVSFPLLTVLIGPGIVVGSTGNCDEGGSPKPAVIAPP